MPSAVASPLLSLALAGIATALFASPASAGEVQPERLGAPGLPNALQLNARVISGGEPAKDAGFQTLQALGVRTIISVDGARPDVETAARFGLRYVHLPHGYDGVPAERAAQLAKAVRDLPGPIYIHCHHGKHRSPAAAAVACVTAGLLDEAKAHGVLKAAGTSPDYRGLFASVASARRIADERLDSLAADFPAIAKVPPLADAMVQIEHTHDRLKAIAENAWQAPAAQPDLVAAHEALLLKEHYRELARTPDAQQQPAEFRELLASAERRAEALERAIVELRSATNSSTLQHAALNRAQVEFDAATQNCAQCHQRFRDVPLGEKK